MHQPGNHQANSIVSQIRTDFNEQLDSRNNEVLNFLHCILSFTSSRSDSDHSQELSTHHKNSETNDTVQLEILKILKQIQLDMKHSTPS